MPFDSLTPQQQAFISAYLKGGLFSRSKDKKTVAAYEAYVKQERAFNEVATRVSREDPQMMQIITDLRAVLDLKRNGAFKDATTGMTQLLGRALKRETELKEEKAALIKAATDLKLVAGATKADGESFEKATAAVAAAMPDDLPKPAQFKAAREALDKAKALKVQIDRMTALAKKNPKAAAAAHDALAEFAKATGGDLPSPESIKAAGEAVGTSKEALGRAETLLKTARALPEGTPTEKSAREEAIKKAEEALEKAKTDLKTAQDRETGLLGTKLLTEAMELGPLSGDTGAPFDDATSEKFIKAFQKDPRLAAKAVEASTGARHPEAVADALSSLSDMVSGGFVDKTGKGLPEGTDPRAYADSILSMGAHCGGDYFGRLNDYIASGDHLKPAGLGDSEDDAANVRAQKRAVAVAGTLCDKDGTIDLSTDKAKTAIGNMLFHPDSMKHPMPAMNDTVLRTLEELKKPKASEILKGMTTPAPGGKAETLVTRALGSTAPATAGDARTAVLATMLKSLDQGPVGSCFSTAPSRRLREGEPLRAMEKFAEIASKGTLTTAKPPAMAVVTNIPPGEDPIMRTLEYTLATTMARDANSDQKSRVKSDSINGTLAIQDDIRTALGKDPGDNINAELWKVVDAVKDGFRIEYDPTAKLEGTSGDGSSTEGRYVMIDTVSKEVITSREKYVTAITSRVLGALGLDANSNEAKALKPLIETNFVDATEVKDSNGKLTRAPWKMPSGGETARATETLFGPMDETETMARNPNTSDTREKQGERTLKVMEGLFSSFGATPPDMVTMKTQSIHGFNALPNNPTLKPILEGPGTMEDKLKAALVDPGKAIATTKLSAERAAKHFEAGVKDSRRWVQGWITNAKDDVERAECEELLKQFDAKAKTLRPTAEMVPSDIADLVVDLRNGFFNKPESAKDTMSALMVQDLGCPEIVIADSNWGDSEDHTFFVVAPDPVSGQPVLWQKTEPPGSMRILDPKWIDDKWAVLTPKTNP